MAQILRPQIADAAKYHGLPWIFEYTNYDGELQTWNCGQAAAATFLTHHGLLDPMNASKNMAWLERHHPPDQFGGYFGTGRRCVERILRAVQFDIVEVNGVEEITAHLERRNPVLLMLGVSSGKFLGYDLPGGHWMVAYGCDGERVQLTNWGTMTWDEIRAGWRKLTTYWVRMNGRGLAKRI
jgi:hypothetical protein